MLLRLRLAAVRLLRLNATPHGVALGFTLGLCLSLFPIPFLGMLVALAVAPLVRASLPAVYAGTAVVNPLTGAAIYFAELWIGGWITGTELPPWAQARDYGWRDWWDLFRELLPVFLIGAGLTMTGSAMISYPVLRWAVARYRRRHSAGSAEPAEPEGTSATQSDTQVEGSGLGSLEPRTPEHQHD